MGRETVESLCVSKLSSLGPFQTSDFSENSGISFGPRLALQSGRKCLFQTNIVPAHRVGPGFSGISNSTELGHGLGNPGCRPTSSSGASSWECSGGANSGGGGSRMGSIN